MKSSINFLSSIFRKIKNKIRRDSSPKNDEIFADLESLGKANQKIERFREIISDPINLLIEKCPEAGYIDKSNNVILHNCLRTPRDGPYSYYGDFSDIFILNRGVHEPLDEYCFQELIKVLQKKNKKEFYILELGCYWAHYASWFKAKLPNSKCYLVEAGINGYECGKETFRRNNMEGVFLNEKVCSTGFTVDNFFKRYSEINSIDLLHSDIQ